MENEWDKKLICIMIGPCPYQTNIEGIDVCVLNKGDCKNQMLGHESISTTQIYLDLTEDELAQAHKKYVV